MARPSRVGLDYFSLDCHMDNKIKLVEAEFGLAGFALVIKLFQKIYGEDGYYMKWSQDVGLLFANETNAGYNLVSEVVKACIKRGIFDKVMFDKYSILTSNGIQKMFYEGAKRRKEIFIKQEYIIFSALKNWVNVCNNHKNVNSNQENEYENEQSKVKESKDMIDMFETALARPLSSNDIDTIMDWASVYDPNLISKAVEQAVQNNGRNMRYIHTILTNWHTAGITSAEEADKQIAHFKAKKHKPTKLKEDQW